MRRMYCLCLLLLRCLLFPKHFLGNQYVVAEFLDLESRMTRPLTIYPAIDLKNGECVRLLHGRMDKATVYNQNPASQAEKFRETGFGWVHIVDLDGAFSGKSENSDAVKAILAAGGLKAQLGGGVRNMTAVEHWLDLGMTRVILGTAAVQDPDFVAAACKAFTERLE